MTNFISTGTAKNALSLGFALVVLFSFGANRAFLQEKTNADYKTFGAPSHLSGAPLALADALQPANLNKPVRVQATVEEVCQMKGCWIVLTDGSRDVRVTFKDYGFFVPKDLAGKTVIAEGVIAEKTISEKTARHYAEDAGKSQDEINKIVGDQKGLAMVAETVLIPQ
jgi:hypothetical protein